MTNKERQAKLQYLLNSLSMTKEQKDIVTDLVNSSGNEGGEDEKEVINIIYSLENTIEHITVKLGDIEYNTTGKTNPENSNFYIHSNDIYELLKANMDKDIIMSGNIDTANGITFVQRFTCIMESATHDAITCISVFLTLIVQPEQ